jgi:hypothetical protein
MGKPTNRSEKTMRSVVELHHTDTILAGEVIRVGFDQVACRLARDGSWGLYDALTDAPPYATGLTQGELLPMLHKIWSDAEGSV